MIKIVIGTTPTIKYKFSVVNPADFSEAILTIKDSRKQEKLRKTLDTATVGTDSIEWTLTQEDGYKRENDVVIQTALATNALYFAKTNATPQRHALHIAQRYHQLVS